MAQAFVSSPVLFALYANDCRSTYTNNYIMKYADDIAILSRLCKDMDLTSYPSEINTFIQWCDKNCLVLNVKKTQEMVLDPRSVSEHKPVIIKDTVIQQVTSYRYLGFYMDSVLCWKTHIDSLCTRLQQRLYFLRRLRLYGVGSKILLVFYQAMFESLIRYGITVWFGNLSIQLKHILAYIHKTAMKIIGIKQYEPIQTLYEQAVMRRAVSISTDPDHPLF